MTRNLTDFLRKIRANYGKIFGVPVKNGGINLITKLAIRDIPI